MSWDLFVQDWGGFESLDKIPSDFKPKVIGDRDEIIKKILKAEPLIDFSDPSWGKLENEYFSIEFNMGESEELYSFAMHVRGSELAIPCIGNILSELNLDAADGATPLFFDVEKSKENFHRWKTYRDKILNRIKDT